MPALAAASTPSGNGKNASDASTLPHRELDPPSSLRSATRHDARHLPAPTPTVRRPVARTIAFDLTCLQTRHAKSSARAPPSVGGRLVATRAPATSSLPRVSRPWTSEPAADALPDELARDRGRATRRSRARAGSSSRGARRARPARTTARSTHSRKVSASARASRDVDRAVERDDAAERDSGCRSRARRGRRPRASAPSATPHGLLCLRTTAAGASNSRTASSAASQSTRLLNESSLPPAPSASARASDPSRAPTST